MEKNDALKQINKSGFPFQLKVVNEINRTKNEHGWYVSSQEHPWSTQNHGLSGFIDIVLSHEQYPTFRLIAECKRVKSDDARQLRWAFLLPEENPLKTSVASSFELEGNGGRLESGAFSWNDYRIWDNVRLSPGSFESGFCVLSGDESNRQPLLERLASEVLESIEGLAEEEVQIQRSLKAIHLRLFIFPAIVTNAELVTCSFDPAKIRLHDGTLDFEDVKLTPVPFIRFRKSLETTFPKGQFHGLATANKARERTVFIVSASGLSEFLKNWELKPLHDQFAVQNLLT